MVERFSEEEILQKVGQISICFPLLECDKCAIAIMEWLSENGIEGKILRLKTKRRSEVFITSDRHVLEESIAENGTHYGVEVLGKVFDNLSADGLSRADWLKSFHCLSERFIVDELDFL
jgi:Papain fold toxin 2